MKQKQRWLKKGVLFTPRGNSAWMKTHAALPVCERRGSHYRIYFSSRDAAGRSRIGYFDAAIENGMKITGVGSKPVLETGSAGSFDESGVTSSCVVSRGEKKYLYYTGWTLGRTVPFYFYAGLAVSRDGGKTFQKISPSPVLERNDIDPYLTASPYVLLDNGIWRMWYVSCVKWEIKKRKQKHYYHIKYAESKDGVKWERRGIVCVDFKSKDEYAFSRPCVLKENGLYKMWYSYRGKTYKIGYAESKDGVRWMRKDDEIDMKPSAKRQDWDFEMMAYPCVLNLEGGKVMLYNGNGYGRTGIGFAELAP